ncbi:MAG: hypothetical protein ACM3MF_09720, partial [Anaerolineae bacterium]
KPIDAALFYDDGVARRLNAGISDHTSPVEAPRRDLLWLLWLMPLPPHQIRSIERRLHFAAPLLKALVASSDLLEEVGSLEGRPPSAWAERLEDVPLISVQAVRLGLEAGLAKTALGRYLDEWRHVKPVTTGHDLTAMGLKPSADYKRILTALRRARLDGEIRTDEEERAYLQNLVKGTARRLES